MGESDTPLIDHLVMREFVHTHTHTHTYTHTHTHAITIHTQVEKLMLRCITTHCNTLQHTAKYCNTLKHTTTHYNALQRTATHCNAQQHTATHCNALCTYTGWNSDAVVQQRNDSVDTLRLTATQQHTATHCNTLNHTMYIPRLKNWCWGTAHRLAMK